MFIKVAGDFYDADAVSQPVDDINKSIHLFRGGPFFLGYFFGLVRPGVGEEVGPVAGGRSTPK